VTKKSLLSLFAGTLATLFCEAQFRPDDLSGLVFWVRADSACVLGVESNVSLWEDVSGNDHDCIQVTQYIQPDRIENTINGLPVVSFDGEDDFMEFPAVNDIRTVLWVVRENQDADPNWPRRSLLGHSSQLNFLRGDGRRIWDSFGNSAVVNGATRLNFQGVNGSTTALPSGFNLISLVTTASVSATHLTMDLNIFGRTWWGEIAEIVIYNQPLSPAEVSLVEEYLADKYTPSFSGFEDVIIESGFCDTTLCAPAGMASYLWSDGSTEECLVINNNGNFSIQTIDAFGRMTNDTFSVQYPGNLDIPDTLICAGEVFFWDTDLLETEYLFEWSDFSNAGSFSTSTDGDFSVIISDNTQCTRQVDFTISIDPFPTLDWLEDSYSLCAGNILNIVPTAEVISINWSGGIQGNQLVVQESGSYTSTLVNTNQCVSIDQTSVSIIGTAPEISLAYSIACAGSAILFEAQSPEAINSWSWDIGQGAEPGPSQIEFTWDTPGIYEVHLTALAANGCAAELYLDVQVYPPPVAAFNYSAPCAGIPVIFENLTIGEIAELEWLSGGESFTTESVELIFLESGSQNISLSVTDANGCADVALIDLFILPSPSIVISSLGGCLGDLTLFEATAEMNGSGSVIGQLWQFGDNTTSTLLEPSHFYASANEYDAQLTVFASNGCSANATLSVSINEPPLLDFNTGNACEGQPFSINSFITVQAGDPVVSYQWTVNGQPFSSDSGINVEFPSLGFHPINLSVVTASGCMADITQQISVWPLPQAVFSFEPLATGQLYTYAFYQEAEGTNLLFEWSFGEGLASTESDPIVIFSESGPREISLRVISLQGCSDLYTRQINVEAPQLDLSILSAELEPISEGLARISVIARNVGNLPVSRMELIWQGGGELALSEVWEEDIEPGSTAQFVFDSAFDPQDITLDYFCVQLSAMDMTVNDVNHDDNQFCKSIQGGGLQLYPPFPNPGDSYMFVRCVTPIQEDVEIRIFDEAGHMIRQLSDLHVDAGFHQYFIDIRELADGPYVLTLILGDQQRSARFIKVTR